MKKLPFILFLCVWACKKQQSQPQPQPQPQPTTYEVFSGIDTTGGQNNHGYLSPTKIKVNENGTAIFQLTTDNGWRPSTAIVTTLDGKNPQVLPISFSTVTVTNVKTDLLLTVKLTDSLETATMNNLRKLLIDSTWHDRVAYSRVSGAHIPPFTDWNLVGYYSPCQQLSYYNFYANGDYIGHNDVGSCDGNPPSIERDKWEITYNGKAVKFTFQDGSTSSVLIDSLTTTKFGYIYENWHGQGTDYKVVATP